MTLATSPPNEPWLPNPHRPYLEMLAEAALDAPDVAFLQVDGRIHSFADVWQEVLRIAGGLRGLGVAEGDTVAVLAENGFMAVTLWFATNALGAISVPINYRLRGEMLAHVVSNAGPRLLYTQADLVERLLAIPEVTAGVEHLVVDDAAASTEVLPNMLSPDALYGNPIAAPVPRAVSDISSIIYTGGTTGPSKGCIIPYGSFSYLGAKVNAVTDRQRAEAHLNPLPLFHLNARGAVVAAIAARGKISLPPKFSLSGFWPEVLRTGAQVVSLMGAPIALIARMADTPEMREAHGQIRAILGQPFPPDLQRIWGERFGVQILGTNSYGLTEGTFLVDLAPGVTPKPGSSGKANADYDTRLMNDVDEEVGVGEVGEIVTRPRRPYIMFSGYWRNTEATVAAWRNLWFHTGDYGRFDADGYFHFVDRKKDYIRRRGENISSQELEAVARQHPSLVEVTIHAVPSDLTEDDVKLTAVVDENNPVSPAELHEWCKQHMPDFAVPRYIEFRSALPKSDLGRVYKFQLRNEGVTPTTHDFGGARFKPRSSPTASDVTSLIR